MALSSYLTGPSAGGSIQTISFTNAANGGFTSGIATYTGNVGVNQGAQPVGEASGTTYIGTGLYSTDPNYQPQYKTYTTTVSFSQALTYFGLYWGSPSGYDTLQLYSAGTLLATFSGSSLSAASYVNFNASAGTTFNQIVMTSGQCCFENNNESYVTAVTAVPEPGTLSTAGMVLLALPVYFYKRRRRA